MFILILIYLYSTQNPLRVYGVAVLSLALAFEIIPPMNFKGRVEHVVHYLSTGKSMSFPVFFALSSDASVIKHSGPDDKVHFLHRRSLNH